MLSLRTSAMEPINRSSLASQGEDDLALWLVKLERLIGKWSIYIGHGDCLSLAIFCDCDNISQNLPLSELAHCNIESGNTNLLEMVLDDYADLAVDGTRYALHTSTTSQTTTQH